MSLFDLEFMMIRYYFYTNLWMERNCSCCILFFKNVCIYFYGGGWCGVPVFRSP